MFALSSCLREHIHGCLVEKPIREELQYVQIILLCYSLDTPFFHVVRPTKHTTRVSPLDMSKPNSARGSKTGWAKYTQIKCIGTGAFGSIWLVDGNAHEGGSAGKFVCKQVHVANLNKKELKDAVNEVYILQMLEHPNIIDYLDHFVDSEGYLNIVMEYCAGGDLNELIVEQRKGGNTNYFTEHQVVYLSFQLLQVCACCFSGQ